MDKDMMEQNQFPSGWIEQLAPILGGQLPDFLHSFDLPPTRGLRMRPGRPPLTECGESIPWAECGWYLPLDSLAGALPAHEAGEYYLQEPSAMVPAAALRPLPGERVLDLCAAPGGKSTQLAALLRGKGLLVCNEPVPARAQILSRNIERMGIPNAAVTCALPEELSSRWPGFFDKILVDAPCSGEGMFRRHPETRSEWSAAAPAGCAQRQAQILAHAARMLRPGGKMAYSTCTFNPVENEGVVEAFLQANPDFSLVPFALPGLEPSPGTLRLWPHKVRGEGHFVALMEKRTGSAEAGKKAKKTAGDGILSPGKNEALLAEAFLREHIDAPVYPNAVFAGRLIMAPENLPPLSGVHLLRLGLHLGEIRGKVFVPDHALALACAPRRALPVTEEEARLYQNGQVLPVSPGLRGFLVPTLRGLSLGWGKASDGQLKNHYPKGLRK